MLTLVVRNPSSPHIKPCVTSFHLTYGPPFPFVSFTHMASCPPPPHTVFVPEDFHIPRWIKSLQINIIHSCGCSSCMIMWTCTLAHTQKLLHLYNCTLHARPMRLKEMDSELVLSLLPNKRKLLEIYLMMDTGENIRNTHINNCLTNASSKYSDQSDRAS